MPVFRSFKYSNIHDDMGCALEELDTTGCIIIAGAGPDLTNDSPLGRLVRTECEFAGDLALKDNEEEIPLDPELYCIVKEALLNEVMPISIDRDQTLMIYHYRRLKKSCFRRPKPRRVLYWPDISHVQFFAIITRYGKG